MQLAIESRFHAFRAFCRSGTGILFREIIQSAICILTAAYFARTETLRTFLEGFGLNRKPSPNVWLGVCVAVVLRMFAYGLIHHDLGPGVKTAPYVGTTHAISLDRFLLQTPILLAPFFEETYMRGFLYKAFRGSCSIGLSKALIVGLTAVTYWNQYSRCWVATISLSGLAVILCYLREKSDSLWDCICCHFVFNFTGLLTGGVLRDLATP